MFSLFFIKRPIFAAVISIVTVVLGLVALTTLPVSRYPELSPPTISVSCVYPGADATTVAETVGATIEKEVNGVEDSIYMSSVSGNSGDYNLTITFEPGTDLDTANVLVQNRVTVAESRLPEEVKRTGVTVRKKSTDTVMFLGLVSPNGTYDNAFLSNYANLRMRDELARVDGVGDAFVYGVGMFSMRIWLDPDQLRARQIPPAEVLAAIRGQNVQVAAGRVGAAPAPEGTAYEYVLRTAGRLTEVEEFENIVVRTDEQGRSIRVRDVARVELGGESYNFDSALNGQPAACFAIYQVPGSNLIEVAAGVREKVKELSESFPDDVEIDIVYDATDVVTASIREVIITLGATLILVVLTVFLFLQNFRATLVPAVTIPVSLIGTFLVLNALGFSLNVLTLFGLVLVIGIVVDDAIVVVENCFVHLSKGLKPKEAAAAAMKEVSGPVVATTLVLLSVFVPTLALGGITGTMFKQFAVTISVATVFSSINALTLSPALCGVLLKANPKEPKGFFRLFNRGLDGATAGYVKIVRIAIRMAVVSVLGFCGLTALSVAGLGGLPTGFVPQEDEGYCLVSVQLPDGAALERTNAVLSEAQQLISGIEGVSDCLQVSGFSPLDNASTSSAGFCVVTFNNWSERPDDHLKQDALIAEINRRLASLQEARAFAFPMPSLPGVGVSGGFSFMLQDRGGVGIEQLQTVSNDVVAAANAQTGLQNVSSTFRATVPQYYIDFDREQIQRTGASMSSVFETIQIYLGSAYVNDFTLFGQVFKVTAQADAPFRATPDDIGKLQFTGADGRMIPIAAVADIKEALGPQTITRFNLYPAVKIIGSPAPGFSSGQAIQLMEDMADPKGGGMLPPSMGYEWTELSYQEKQAGGGMMAIFGFAILMVYLVLAAQYESWTLPISVCLSVPTALFGLILAVMARNMDNNVYTQIGIVLLIGLSTKTAILLTEFAKLKREEGMSIFDSAVESVRLRFRAVMMTALSFVLGVIPLLVASGAGAESRKILGTAVCGGMLAATAFSLAVVPMLYYVVQKLSEGRQHASEDSPSG
ncbi:efflux RND transporter permease subunit [Haloferula rosea]|uniref:Efflux RND transporter permease subunit n=1 Tax=Haloferula rosea TaxID=490093 RepID=A0A934RBM2_9BACT|nr:multidrug efflux RND transporter permease subunit [Haloferula rosea]MBK1827560.1 efflux RND transporter permease subunit [Haloferula rosea]